MDNQVQFMGRGESFYLIFDDIRYTGACAWRRDRYCLFIFVKSFRYAGWKQLIPLSKARKMTLANKTKEILLAEKKVGKKVGVKLVFG